MLALKKIAVTGGVASGKSTVCRLFQERGACVVSADEIAHELLDGHTELGRRVIQLLGPDIVQDGRIDRRRVAEKVFKDPKLLSALEALLHPAVLQKIEERYKAARAANQYPLFIVEIPLVFEIHAQSSYDAVIAVVAEDDVAQKRFGDRAEYKRRMQRQLSPQIKSAKANYTLHNNGSLAELRAQVGQLYDVLTSE